MWKKIKPYVLLIALSLAAGGLSALLSGDMTLTGVQMPLLSPPPVVFPIVWTVLYILMGFSAARVYEKKKEDPGAARSALQTFYLNLALNFLWSPVFFRLRAYLFALLVLLALSLTVLSMIGKFKKIDKTAGNLQIPYLVWCLFATYLNASIWILNR